MKKAFTLIELLIVVAVIATLAVVSITTINPVELFRQGRDATRVSDMGTLNKAVSLYYQDAMASPSTMFMGTSSVIYVSVPDPTAPAPAGNNCSGLNLPTAPTGYTYHCAASSTYFDVNGIGWIPINFNAYSAGSVISKLPIDPVNQTSSNLYYTYQTDGTGGYRLTAFFESKKDAPSMASDGGIDPDLYEKGTNLALADGRGLVGYWPLNEGSGSTAIDWSGNEENGSSTQNITWSNQCGDESSCMTVTSTLTGIILPPSTAFEPTTNFTISNWVMVNSPIATSSWPISFGSGSSSGTAFAYLWRAQSNGTGWMFQWGTDYPACDNLQFTESSAYNININLGIGTWNYLVATYNGTTVSVYKNGSLLGNVPGPSGGSMCISPSTFYIGDTFGAENDGSYSVSDARMYNRILNATEIQEIYNAGN